MNEDRDVLFWPFIVALAVVIALWAGSVKASAQTRSVRAVIADQQGLAAAGFDPGDFAYFTAELDPPEAKADLRVALPWIIGHATRSAPWQAADFRELSAGELWRVNSRALGWSRVDRVVNRSPYRVRGLRLARASWFVVEAGDPLESDAYFELLFGSKPSTAGQWLRLLGARRVDESQTYGALFRGSGVLVNKQSQRWAEALDVSGGRRGYFTRDPLAPDAENDPLELAAGDFEEFGSEYLVQLPNGLIASCIADSDGRLIDEAPVKLVQGPRWNGSSAIRSAFGCMVCHAEGWNTLPGNDVLELARSGILPRRDQAKIAAFHLSVDVNKTIDIENRSYRQAVRVVTGAEARDAVAAVRRVVAAYNRPLGLKDLARELEVTPNALAAMAQFDANAPASIRRLVVRDDVVSRELVEGIWPTVRNQILETFGSF